MSLIALSLNGLLAVLLIAALTVGLRLNGRLKALRESQDGFEAAVAELNIAAQRAEQGLADLRAATDEATDVLSDRIEKGRALATRLESLTAATPERPHTTERFADARGLPPVSPPARDDVTSQRLAALLAMARGRLDAEAAGQRPAFTPLNSSETPPSPSRATPRRLPITPDEDLFEDALELDRPLGVGR